MWDFQEKTTKLLQCKAELAEAQQIAMLSRRGTEDLELNNYKMDEVRMAALARDVSNITLTTIGKGSVPEDHQSPGT